MRMVWRAAYAPYYVAAVTADGESFPAEVHVKQTLRMFRTARTPSVPVLRGSLYDSGYRVRLEGDDLAHPGISGYEISYGPSGTAAWRTIVANAGNLLQYGNDTIPRLASSETRTAESMFVFNAFRDEGSENTDGRKFRIRALQAAGNSAGPTGGALAVGEELLRPSPLPESRQQESIAHGTG